MYAWVEYMILDACTRNTGFEVLLTDYEGFRLLGYNGM
jgi:hypothetical protein